MIIDWPQVYPNAVALFASADMQATLDHLPRRPRRILCASRRILLLISANSFVHQAKLDSLPSDVKILTVSSPSGLYDDEFDLSIG